MSTQFWWIFDALVVIIAGYVIYSNARRGLTKVLVLSIGYIVATVLASVLATVAAPTLYEAVARSSNISAIETTNTKVDFPATFLNAINEREYGIKLTKKDVEKVLREKADIDFDTALYQYLCHRNGQDLQDAEELTGCLQKHFVQAYGKEVGERMPEYVRMNFQEVASVNPAIMRNIIKELYGTNQSAADAAEHIEDQFSRDPTIEVLQIFIYLIIFSILMVFSALLSAALQNSIFINIRRGTDHAVGGLMGVLEAGVMLIMLTIVVRLLLLLNGGDLLCFNKPTIAATKVFHYLYDNLNIML